MTAKRWISAVALLTVGTVASCVDGTVPTGIQSTGVARLALVPVYETMAGGLADQAAEVNRIRLTATKASDGTVIIVQEQDVDPTAEQWSLDMGVPVPEGGAEVMLTIELINITGSDETVEWSGQTGPLTLTAGQAAEGREVAVVRGPLSNLSVTGVDVTPDTIEIIEGDTLRLTATATTTSTDAPVIFWASLDASVSVDGSGLATGVLAGLGRVVAQAGGLADTAAIFVRSIDTDVELSKTVSLDTATVGDALTYEVRVINHGPQTVDSVVVVDTVDEWGLTGISVLEDGFARSSGLGSPAGDTLVSGPLAAGDTALLRWVGSVDTVAAANTLWNSASIELVFGASDTTLTNNRDSVWTWVKPIADIQVGVSVDEPSPAEGDTVAFTVAVTNLGPSTATNVLLQGHPDIGLDVAWHSDLTDGVVDTLAGTWFLDSIPHGVSQSVVIWVAVDSGTVGDTLQYGTFSTGLTDEHDPDLSNDSASASVVVGERTTDMQRLGVGFGGGRRAHNGHGRDQDRRQPGAVRGRRGHLHGGGDELRAVRRGGRTAAGLARHRPDLRQ
jgi:uncharacterized repeat protein (TIGR01451 family)